MLYIVATPIGNLDDISKRALETLKSVDSILCEDTRKSLVLLNHFEIKKKCIPYHKFNEKKSLDALLNGLKAGKSFALISDAGTPCINDPGHDLIKGCIQENIPYTLIPGPCSVIQALVLSGMNASRFQFIGFLPKTSLEKVLRGSLLYPGTTLAFESPNRIISTLKKLKKMAPDASLAVLREMTKLYEEVLKGTPENLLFHFEKKPPKGEIVLAMEGGAFQEDIPSDELIKMLQEFHALSLKEAVKAAAKLQNVPKRELYQKMHDF